MNKLMYFIFIYLISPLVFATHWPIFVAPDKDFLLRHNFIETRDCPAGEGRIKANLLINIKEFLCKNFCPGIWNWISASEEKCQSIADNFFFKGYEIFNYYENGTANFSVITASYGNLEKVDNSIKFVFTSLPGDYWHCHEMNADLHFISCANDI